MSEPPKLDPSLFAPRAARRLDEGEIDPEAFPFDAPLTVKAPPEPVLPEPSRFGLDESECRACTTSGEEDVWSDDNWRVQQLRRLGVPGFLVVSRSHLDAFGEYMASRLAAG